MVASHARQPSKELWNLVDLQHGVIARRQLLEAGLSAPAIKHRLDRGRLHRRARGVYAVGRRGLSRKGEMMVAVLACGPEAVVSHETAAELWGLRRRVSGRLEASAPASSGRRPTGVRLHRRVRLDAHTVTTRDRVPVTTVPAVMVDMSLRWPERHLEAAVNQADALDLLDPEAMRRALDAFAGQAGVRNVRQLLDAATFRLTDSELERRFLRLVAQSGLPVPDTQRYVSSHRVDFVWPELGLVVETDSLRYHRTPLEQSRDRARDHAHLAAGLTAVRFTHQQVRWDPQHVLEGLADVARMAAMRRSGSRVREP